MVKATQQISKKRVVKPSLKAVEALVNSQTLVAKRPRGRPRKTQLADPKWLETKPSKV